MKEDVIAFMNGEKVTPVHRETKGAHKEVKHAAKAHAPQHP